MTDERKESGEFYPGGRETQGGGGSGGGGDTVPRVPVTQVEELPERYRESDMRSKINQLCRIVSGGVAALALMVAAKGAEVTVQGARKDALYNEDFVVTNVTVALDGLVTTNQLQEGLRGAGEALRQEIAGATNAVKAELIGGIEGATNAVKVELIGEIAGATNAVAGERAAALAPYATKDWVAAQGFAADSALEGYATQGWVTEQGYAPKSWVEGRGYMTGTNLAPYATKDWVEGRGYMTGTNLTPYATKEWVEGKGYATREEARERIEKGAEEAVRRIAAEMDGTTAHRLMVPGAWEWIDGTGAIWRVNSTVEWRGVTLTGEMGATNWIGEGWSVGWEPGEENAEIGTWRMRNVLSEAGPLEVEWIGEQLPYGEGGWKLQADKVTLSGVQVTPGQIAETGWYQIADTNDALHYVSPLVTTVTVARVTNAVDRLARLEDAGITTNDVCNIVTNRINEYVMDVQDDRDAWMVDQDNAHFVIRDVKWISTGSDTYTVTWIGNGISHTIDGWPNQEGMVSVCVDNGMMLYFYDDTGLLEDKMPLNSQPTSWSLMLGSNGGFDGEAGSFVEKGSSPLGLAFLSDIPSTNGLASYSITTNYVDNALTNRPTKAQMDEGWWSDWTFSDVMQGVSDITVAETTVGGDPALVFRFKYGNEIWLAYAGLDISTLTAMGGYDGLPSGTLFTATRHRVAAPVPTKISDLANDTGYVTASITNGLASAETATNIAESVAEAATEGMITIEMDPNWNAEKDGYATTGEVSQVSAAVGTLWSYVYGDSAWIAVTNYMRTIGGVSPSFQLWEVRGGATNLVYWSKEEITNVTHDLIHDCKTNLEATVRNAVAEMPDKAWSKYQSATGNEAPDGVTIVSTPTIQLTGGGEWYRYIDVASNSVWFLKSNGMHTFGGDTNGYFRILDDEGNTTFEVRKTDSYLVDAVASSVHFDESGNFCVSFQSNIQPVIYTTASLAAPNFLPEGDDPNVTVTWTQSGGTYTATLAQTVKGPSLFAYAKVEVLGTTVIKNTAPTDVSGGILCTDGVHKCRPVYNSANNTITWEVVP